MNEDRIWALKESTKPSGFTPHSASAHGFLVELETEGLIRQSANDPVWLITDRGRIELQAAIAKATGEK